MKSGDRSIAILSHVLGIFTGFIGPLIILLVTKDDFARRNAKNALNWQLTAIIYTIVSFILVLLLIGILLLIALSIIDIVFSVIAAVKANEGKEWKYPLTIPFLK